MERKAYPVRRECNFINKRSYRSCLILSEMFCATRGKCKFYKTEEQFEEDLKKYPWIKDVKE